MTKFEKIIQILGQISLIGFIVTFPFNFSNCKYFQAGVALFALINPILWKNLKLNNFKKEEKVVIIIGFAYVLWEFITLLWSDNFRYGFNSVVASLPIWLFPWALTFMRLGEVIKKTSLYLKIFSISILASSLVCLYLSYSDSFYVIDGVERFSVQKPEYIDRSIFEALTSGYSNLSYIGLSHFTKPHYLSQALCLVILVAYNWIYENKTTITKTVIGIAIILYSSIFIYLLLSRTNIIILALIFIIITINEIFNKKHKLLALPLIIVGIIGISFIWKSERIQDAYTKFQNGKTDGNLTETNTRLDIWESAYNVIKKYPILGTGIGDNLDALEGEYILDGKIDLFTKGFGSHNQFLQSQIGKGIIGSILTIVFIGLPLWYGIKRKDYKLIGFFLIIFINKLFDNDLICYWSLVFCSMTMWLLLLDNQEKLRLKSPKVQSEDICNRHIYKAFYHKWNMDGNPMATVQHHSNSD